MTIVRNFSNVAPGASSTGVISAAKGGTGLSSVGTSGYVLTSDGTNWTSAAAGGGGVTSVTGTAPVVSSGGTTPAISMAAATASVNGYMTSTYASKLDGIAAGATANTGTVTSVATGNGLSGGTITSSGTLTIAAPSFNTVGSYAWVYVYATASKSSGSNYSAGGSSDQFQSYWSSPDGTTGAATNNLSGTWKWMSGTAAGNPGAIVGLVVRVS